MITVLKYQPYLGSSWKQEQGTVSQAFYLVFLFCPNLIFQDSTHVIYMYTGKKKNDI